MSPALITPEQELIDPQAVESTPEGHGPTHITDEYHLATDIDIPKAAESSPPITDTIIEPEESSQKATETKTVEANLNEKQTSPDTGNSKDVQTAVPITEQPEATQEPKAQGGTRSNVSHSSDDSSYQGDRSDCHEFCVDIFSCFGALNDCCPQNGQGCFSSCMGFVTNICVSIR